MRQLVNADRIGQRYGTLPSAVLRVRGSAWLRYCFDEAAVLAGQQADEADRAEDTAAAAAARPAPAPAAAPDPAPDPLLTVGADGTVTSIQGTIPFIGPKTPAEVAAWRAAGRFG